MRVPRLTALLTICFGLVSAALTAFVATVVTLEASNSMTGLVERELAQMSKQASDRIDRYMFERWSDVSMLADQIGQVDSDAAVRRMIDRLKERYKISYVWIGYLDPDCRVRYASNGVERGTDLSDRDWCRYGKIAPFIGHMRFTKYIHRADGTPYAVLDIAMPVYDARGEVKGVVTAHVDASYLYRIQRSNRPEIAEGQPTESFVIAKDGTVVAGPANQIGVRVGADLLSQITTQATGIRAPWPDGDGYVAGATVAGSYEDYPGLGWIIVTRGKQDDALAVVSDLRNRVLGWGMGLSVLAVVLAFLLARWVGEPLHRLAAAAEGDMNLGEHKRSGRFREISELTRALNHRFNNMQMAHEALVLANHRTSTALHDRETLLKEVHHRVKNNLQVIISTLRLQGSRIRNSPSTKGVVERLTNRVQVLGWLYSKLYEQLIFENIQARTVLEPLIEQIQQTYYCDVSVDVSIDDAEIGFDQTLVLGMIVIELLSNALCHAYPSQEGRVIVRLKNIGETDYEFAVLDEGVSFDTTQKYAGVGLTLSQRMAQQLGGPLEMVSDDTGTRMRIRFRLETPGTVLPGESRAA